MTYIPELRDSLVRAASREYASSTDGAAPGQSPAAVRAPRAWFRSVRRLPVALALVVSAAVAIVALTTLKPATTGPSTSVGKVRGGPVKHAPGVPNVMLPPPENQRPRSLRPGAVFAAEQIRLSAPTPATRQAANASPSMGTATAAMGAWEALPVLAGGRSRPRAGLFEVTWGQPTHRGVTKNVPFPAWVVWSRGPIIFTGVGTPPKKRTKCTDVGIYDLQIDAWVADFQTC